MANYKQIVLGADGHVGYVTVENDGSFFIDLHRSAHGSSFAEAEELFRALKATEEIRKEMMANE